MEWNWLGGNNNNNMTPFFLSESTGDSEEVKSHVHEQEDETAMDEQEGVLFQFSHDHQDDDDDDDDAQSCSYDHSSYNKTGNIGYDHESQRLVSYDDDDVDDGEIEDDEDDKNKNDQCQGKLMCSSKQQWRSCVHDPTNQRESDRKFWEACLAS